MLTSADAVISFDIMGLGENNWNPKRNVKVVGQQKNPKVFPSIPWLCPSPTNFTQILEHRWDVRSEISTENCLAPPGDTPNLIAKYRPNPCPTFGILYVEW